MRSSALEYGAFLLAFIVFPARCQEVVIDAPAGPIVGHPVAADASLHVFEAIPYALPPVGLRRWRPPEPHPPWSSAYDGRGRGKSCPMIERMRPHTAAEPAGMSEDCLQLNVWTPSAPPTQQPDELLPVFFIIHGGAFAFGSGVTEPFWHPVGLVADQRLVAVSINYRLGALGWLAHPSIGETTNFMLLDQKMALQWVQTNIRSFGGDPSRVTLYGLSAGGQSVLHHLVWPLSEPLFHRAIISSAPIIEEASMEEAYKRRGERLQRAVAAKNMEEMRNVHWSNLTAVQPPMPFCPLVSGRDVQMASYAVESCPVVDNNIVTHANLITLAKQGGFQKKPVIISTADDEYPLLLQFVGHTEWQKLANATAEQTRRFVANSFGRDKATKILHEYESVLRERDPLAMANAYAGDAMFSCPNRRLAMELSKRRVPVYTSLWRTILPPGNPLGAMHGIDWRYHGHIRQQLGQDRRLQDMGQDETDAWTEGMYLAGLGAFVRGEAEVKMGNGVVWETTGEANGYATLEIDRGSIKLVGDTVNERHHCEFWDAFATDQAYSERQPFAIPPDLFGPPPTIAQQLAALLTSSDEPTFVSNMCVVCVISTVLIAAVLLLQWVMGGQGKRGKGADKTD
ncbi:unnamed protein product [Vitrella brassicaformis CCMP3155]|uniref:Carboxylic ester hydrolase n=1 Tax=Vitrella brassicaformis (strain CCMP3155) TaxID=1169540 RepID=A0A0G4EHA6_VITBC|nr:unnamed protein product [Vitrella brassicaformis CCMP3155]|mmetsp:Transcript_40742/g.101861  ORF Transcript_40742/g.101861 Transcript_40742/m.101861 type:complete len:626 (-) Transcript_40742:1289-3166(-)|eukprot:CEL95362.1 unnamed protein product [Vitrella brassicaformis CCMP3155]